MKDPRRRGRAIGQGPDQDIRESWAAFRETGHGHGTPPSRASSGFKKFQPQRRDSPGIISSVFVAFSPSESPARGITNFRGALLFPPPSSFCPGPSYSPFPLSSPSPIAAAAVHSTRSDCK
jgi:hypothetical protein